MLAFLVLVLHLLPLESMASLNSEGYALLSFKNSISEDPEHSLSNWNISDQNPCAWNGVTCKDLSVVSLSIPNKKLSGFLPSQLGSISALRHLNLRNNRLHGQLPSELFSGDSGLQSLVLYGNLFSGEIPKQVGELKYLQTLDISSNFFNGSFPESLMSCNRLRNLDLSRNNLTGALPESFGAGFVSLESLDLSFNAFNGSLPGDIGKLTGLKGTVDFSRNRFSGEIPASLGALPEKVYIDLTYNNLTGPIPQTGALMNRGPTAFIGNPYLCGPPLKIPCSASAAAAGESPSSEPYLPASNSTQPAMPRGKSKGLSKSAVIAIVVSDAIGICLLGLLFSFCYSKSCRGREKDDKGLKNGRRGCFLFSRSSPESVSEDENYHHHNHHHGLVSLDGSSSSSAGGVGFDLDELLKASAFVLGKSGIGIVYKVVLENGVSLAVRRLGEGGSQQRLKEFQTEVEAVGKLRHPNVAALKAYYWSVDEKLLIYDYVNNGNLSAAIHGKPGTANLAPLSWASRLKVMKGMARGLMYIHEFSPKKYVHGDLKPTNVLLDNNFDPRISDFGLARLANIAASAAGEKHLSETHSISAVGSSSSYVAPEASNNKAVVKPSQKWDVYSYGAIVLEMITGRSSASEGIDLVRWIQICVEEKKSLSEVLDPSLEAADYKEDEIVGVIKIAMACVHTSPEKRPAMRQVSEALERISN